LRLVPFPVRRTLPPQSPSRNLTRAQQKRQPGGNRNPPQVEIDPDLARILDAWPTLPEPIRRAMLALAENGR